MQNLHPKQISKVVYEATRAYGVTIGEPEKKSWEDTIQSDRDAVITKVDALLSGAPQAAASIRPSDQIKAKILSAITGVFVQVYNPPVVYGGPFIQPEPAGDPIPVETFGNPDSPEAVLSEQGTHVDTTNALREKQGLEPIPTISIPRPEPKSVPHAMELADARIAAADKPVAKK